MRRVPPVVVTVISQRITRSSTGPIREIHDPSGSVRSTGSRRLPVTRMSRSAPVAATALTVGVPANPRSASTIIPVCSARAARVAA